MKKLFQKYSTRNITPHLDWNNEVDATNALVEIAEYSEKAITIIEEISEVFMDAHPAASIAEPLEYLNILDACGIYGERIEKLYEAVNEEPLMILVILDAVVDETLFKEDLNSYIDGIAGTATEKYVGIIRAFRKSMDEFVKQFTAPPTGLIN